MLIQHSGRVRYLLIALSSAAPLCSFEVRSWFHLLQWVSTISRNLSRYSLSQVDLGSLDSRAHFSLIGVEYLFFSQLIRESDFGIAVESFTRNLRLPFMPPLVAVSGSLIGIGAS